MSKNMEKLTTPKEIRGYFSENKDELRDFLRGARGITLEGDDESLQEISLPLVVALNVAVGMGEEIEELAEQINHYLIYPED